MDNKALSPSVRDHANNELQALDTAMLDSPSLYLLGRVLSGITEESDNLQRMLQERDEHR